MARVVQAAWEGRLAWVDKIIRRAGYTRGDTKAVPTRVVGKLYRVTARAVGMWHAKSGCPRNSDSTTYDLAAVIEWHEGWKIDTLNHQSAIEEGAPGIERLRLAKAAREEIALERDRGRLIAREDVHQALGRLATILRGAGEGLGRQYGADAQGVLDEALADFTAEARNSFRKAGK